MITGNIEDELHPRIQVTVVGPSGNSVQKMLVDTGFDGDVAMHYDDADRFQLELIDYLTIEYASGDSIEEIYCCGTILWFGEKRQVQIILSNDEEPAIGTLLLQSCVMNMNFIEHTLTIEKPSY
ncbi:MAG: hypothetical protein ACE5I1_13655 [bacterium]